MGVTSHFLGIAPAEHPEFSCSYAQVSTILGKTIIYVVERYVKKVWG
jgi:hypothetical protein